MERCRDAWSDFREFAHSMAHGAIVHALAQVRLHYPLVDLERVATGRARGTSNPQIANLEDGAEEPARRPAEDVELFGQGQGSAQ